MGFGMIVGWLIFIAIGFAIYYIISNKENFITQSDAQNILDVRYAKGEIDEKEYREKSANLKHG